MDTRDAMRANLRIRAADVAAVSGFLTAPGNRLVDGLLDLIDRPTWRTVIGGSRVYVAALAEPLGRALIGRAAVGVKRGEDGVDVTDAAGETQRYDRLVLATHADEALRLIDRPTRSESELLGAFHYIRNEATLHTDCRAMPRRRAAWSSWNYMAKGQAKGRSCRSPTG